MRIVLTIFIVCLFSCTRPALKKVEPEPSSSPTVEIKHNGKVLFQPVDGYATSKEKAIILKAGEKMNEIVQSKCFYDAMSTRDLIQTNGKTPKEVAEHLQSLSGTIPVVMYYRRLTSAVAYRQPPSLTININRRFFGESTPLCEWASVFAHESLGHSLGNYGHDYNSTTRRPFSVPYSENFAVEKCCHD